MFLLSSTNLQWPPFKQWILLLIFMSNSIIKAQLEQIYQTTRNKGLVALTYTAMHNDIMQKFQEHATSQQHLQE
jgi:hypothetical protein